jgi:hypothetical protein
MHRITFTGADLKERPTRIGEEYKGVKKSRLELSLMQCSKPFIIKATAMI